MEIVTFYQWLLFLSDLMLHNLYTQYSVLKQLGVVYVFFITLNSSFFISLNERG
jgi:hypothetical protein